VLRKGWSIGALVILVSFVCLLPTRAGYPEDQPKLLNPFAGDPEAVKEGRRLSMSNGCSGCHGLGGGGGMGKPILDDVWEFGSDDETLYKLIKGQIPKQTMPTGAGLPDEQVWKLLAYVRSFYKGNPSLINWGLTPPPDAAARIAALSRPISASKPPKGLQDMEIPTPSDNPPTAKAATPAPPSTATEPATVPPTNAASGTKPAAKYGVS
jgi:mono/diheme cytochrome c family protein